ncbi:hypothetical protein [Mucilaginibacter gotjawali]|uniref:Addiction module component n=1 Tax=Mucilaginibacter gotjawali TaxID=1550579 RepID=A0A839SB61_9SPHI|nr:hypothetical protein [Mucilaginibacter gotjawali]MBB3054818.1 hypothetical protein [Mucilaginibacter gotjawali]
MEEKDKSKIRLNAKKSLPTNQMPPEWQIELGKKELQNIAGNQTELINWTEAKRQFRL